MLNLFDLFYSIDERRRFGGVATFQYVSPLFLILTYVSCEFKITVTILFTLLCVHSGMLFEYCASMPTFVPKVSL